MFCYNCGTRLEDFEKFCYNCGAKVRDRSGNVPVKMTPAPEPVRKEENVVVYGPAPGTPEALKAATDGSIGDIVPDEPNQYNYKGEPKNFFLEVLTAAFPEYTVRMHDASYPTRPSWERGPFGSYRQIPGKPVPAYIFTVQDGSEVKLAVELLSQASKNRKNNRKTFEEQHIPFTRFYYDVDGWWNTKSYIRERAYAAIRK